MGHMADSSTTPLLERLKKRKLVQWALGYLAGAWVLLEVFSNLQDGLGCHRAYTLSCCLSYAWDS